MPLKPNLQLDEFDKPSFELWKTKVFDELKGLEFFSLKTKTYDNFFLEPIYTFNENKEILANLSLPFENNYVRNHHFSPNFLDFPISQPNFEQNPKQFNQNLQIDLQMGLSSIFAEINTNTRSVSIQSKDDIHQILENIDLSKTEISLLFNLSEQNFVDEFINFFHEIPQTETIQKNLLVSPFLEFIANGNFPKNKHNLSQLLANHIKKVNPHFPNSNTILIDSSIFADSGGNAINELSLAISQFVEILELLENDFSVADLSKEIIFQFSLSPFFMNDIAKIRAFRILMANVLEQYKIQHFDYQIWGKSNLFYRTNSEEFTNILRATTESFAGILAQCDRIMIYPHNFRTAIPNDFSRRISRNTQIILNNESHLNKVIDSAGGSYFLENQTISLAEQSWKAFQEIENSGGFFNAFSQNFIQLQIDSSRKNKISDINRRKLSLIGTNIYVKNTSEFSVSELQNVYFKKFEFPTENVEKLNFSHAGFHFENLQIFVKTQLDKTIQILGIGEISDYKLRAEFSKSLFETAFFDVNLSKSKILTFEELHNEIQNSKSKVVVLASKDKFYEELIKNPQNKIQSEKIIILAGLPKNEIEIYKNLGISDFIYSGMDVFTFLSNIAFNLFGKK
jgi:methylmalonyl-CoA mutase